MANGIPRIWPLPPDDELQRVERGRERNAQGFQFIKDDLRSEADRRNAGLFSGGGERTTSGASSTAHYLTSQAESGLSNEVNLGALTTGILKHTVSAGVSTPATAAAGTDYAVPGANGDITSLTGLTGGISTPTGVTFANGATVDAGTGVGNAYKLRARATTGGVWVDLITLTNAALAPTLDFPTGATWNGNEIYHATGTDVPLTDGGTGASTAAGALLNITGWVESFVTSANFTTSSTTLVNITGLTFAAAANKTYEIDALLYIDTSAVTTGVKFGVNYSAAGAAVYALINATSTTNAGSLGTLNTIGGSSANTYLTTSDISGVCHIKGFVTTGANTGNITIQGLKVTSGTLTVYRGSRLMVRELTT